MSVLFQTIAFVFGLVGLGYAAALSGYLRQEVGEALAEFCVSVALPLLLFRTMANADFAGASPWLLWTCYFIAVAFAWASGQIVITRLFGRDRRAGIVGGVASGFSNLVLLGIPFVLGTFGTEGFAVLSLLVSVHLPAMLAASMLQFEWAARGGRAAAGDPHFLAALGRGLLTNPLIVGVLAGLAWRMAGVQLPEVANRLIDSLANVAAPVALFAIGLTLKKYSLSGNYRPALAVTAIKLVAMPTVALVMALLLALPPLPAKIVVVAAALPSGVNPFLIATQFGTGQALASNALTLGTAFAVVSTSVWVLVVQLVFG